MIKRIVQRLASIAASCWLFAIAPNAFGAIAKQSVTSDGYARAVELVKGGRNLRTAISLLEAAAKNEPANAQIQISLGCACISRCASLALAIKQSEKYQSEMDLYQFRLTAWESLNKQFLIPAVAAAFPFAPQAPATPDDGLPLEASPAPSLELRRLLGRALLAFEDAEKARSPGTTNESLDAIRGWALLILMRDCPDALRAIAAPGSPSIGVSHSAKQLDSASYFERVVKAEPDNLEAWIALAIALVPRDFGIADYSNIYIRGRSVYPEATLQRAITALERAKALRPSHFHTQYMLALLTSAGAPDGRCETYLRNAAHLRAGNAVLSYLLAEREFKRAEGLESAQGFRARLNAVRTIERGNAARGYSAIHLRVQAPSLLAKAWECALPVALSDNYLASSLFSYLHGFTRDPLVVSRENIEVRVAQAQVRFGLKVLHSASRRDLDLNIPTHRTSLTVRAVLGSSLALGAISRVEEMGAAVGGRARRRFLDEYEPLNRAIRAAMRANLF